MEFLKNVFFGLDPLSVLVGAVLSALIALWLDFFIKQPKLERNGSGSGHGGGKIKTNTLSFNNKVGWFGINLPESRILGFRIHPHLMKGLTFYKHSAQDCRASLFLKSTGEHIGSLWWKLEGNQVLNMVNIESGKQATLMLFCRKIDEDSYFVFQPISSADITPRVPDLRMQFIGGQEFILRVSYSQSLKYEESIKIEKKYNGLLYLKTKNSETIF